MLIWEVDLGFPGFLEVERQRDKTTFEADPRGPMAKYVLLF